jgi:hypothetical protein
MLAVAIDFQVGAGEAGGDIAMDQFRCSRHVFSLMLEIRMSAAANETMSQ